MWTGFKKKTGFHSHQIKLKNLPEMDCGFNMLSHSTVCLIRNLKSRNFMAVYLRPCVSIEWFFDAIGWSWLSWRGLGKL